MTQDQALAILKTGVSVFLTGEPGSGKTHTVNRYVDWLRSHEINPAITASTGIAATHIGGRTIHSWSGIGIKNRLSGHDLSSIAGNSKVAQRIRQASVLIIDEISMLSADTLTMISSVCKKVRGGSEPFGGLQFIMVGDFFQLPPVVKSQDNDNQRSLLSEVAPQSKFAFASSAWRALNPTVCYLSEQHRQEDVEFLGFLSALREGKINSSHHDLIKSRITATALPGATQLFSHNVAVDRINDAKLAQLPDEAKNFSMTSHGPSELVDQIKRGCLSPELLTLKVGAKVMFTKNEPSFKYVNGTLGTVTGFAKESGSPIVKTNSDRIVMAEPSDWVLEEGDEVLARVTQLPLRLAWAITVHKSQGMSLDMAHMDLSHVFEYGQGYVALSRVRTLDGLTLTGFNRRALEVHPDIQAIDLEFRASSQQAQEEFADLSADEAIRIQTDFIKRCGGKKATPAVLVKEAKTKRRERGVGQKSVLETIREKHPTAYKPWSEEQEYELRRRFQAGEKISHIAESLGRGSGAIRARLIKLGLIEEE